MKDKRMHAKFWHKNLKSGDLLEDAGIHTNGSSRSMMAGCEMNSSC